MTCDSYISDTDDGAEIEVDFDEESGQIGVTLAKGKHVDDTWTLTPDEARLVAQGIVAVIR